MAITMLVSLYTSRVVLNTLGIEDYGIYNLVGGVVVLFSFLSGALNGSIQRFLTFELGRNNLIRFKQIFNVSLISLSFLSIVIVFLMEIIGVWLINNKLVIPIDRLSSAHWIFQLSLLTFIININMTPYNSAIIAHERMSIYAYFGILETFLKLLAILLLPLFPFDKLIVYGSLILIMTLIVRSVNINYCKRKIEGCRFSFFFDKKTAKEILSFSGWSMLGGMNLIMITQGISILFNVFCGIIVNSALGICNQVSNSLFQFVSNFQTAFSPQITKQYANKEFASLYPLVYRSAKFSFFLLLLIVAPVIVNINDVLVLWLVQVPEYTASFCLVILLMMLIDSISGPLWMLISATGDIKTFQIVLFINGCCTILLMYFFLYQGFSPVTTLSIRIFVSIGLLIIRLVILHFNLKFPVKQFCCKVLLRTLIPFVILMILGYSVHRWVVLDSAVYRILIRSLIMFVSYAIIVPCLGMEKTELKFITENIKHKINLKR